MDKFTKALAEYFSFDSFRPGQEEIVKSLVEGHDTLAIMPTGGGKSLCYQLPAVLSSQLTIVVSPLIALMKDQVDGLVARGISAKYINSTLSAAQIRSIYQELSENKIKLLYIAPERFGSQSFKEVFTKLQVRLVAIDEAHCISQWGHDFRPEYALLDQYFHQLPQRPTIAAFTATATPEVKTDIIHKLQLRKPQVFVRGFDRPNLKFFIQTNVKQRDRCEEVLRLCKSIEGSGVVYCLTVKETETLASFLNAHQITAQAYHAKLSVADRSQIQEDFMENKYRVIVATLAFGMGVDKADIRYVIHNGMPPSMERYYQEAGRAGRDGEVSFCILLHNGRDAGTHHYFFQNDRQLMLAQGKPYEQVQALLNGKYRMLDSMKAFVTSSQCRRRFILEYFEDIQLTHLASNCQKCDVCLNYDWTKAAKSVRRRKKHPTSTHQLSATILETAANYLVGKTPEQIAKIRSLGVTTIYNHLAEWYQAGGNLDYGQFVNPVQEATITQAIKEIGSTLKLRPIKDSLPKAYTYEQIKLVLAKHRRENNLDHANISK